MRRPGGRVAILGGGMAGLSAAWRLSEPEWRDRFDSITVYQRGWRLGGKGASSRGAHGRIEEHGLHLWLGSYQNAFGLLRECYAELDRAATDPAAPITTWDQALIPADNVGLADRLGSDWLIWLGTFTRTDGLPGEPDSTGAEMTAVEFTVRALRLVRDFAESLRGTVPVGLTLSTCPEPPPTERWIG
ncbi:MAG: FAD-dependent oxidoreductase, partial [Mycobacterium sp.]